MTSHAQEREIETRNDKYTKVTPTLPEGARKILLGFVDIILFCDLEAETDEEGKPTYRRVLRTKPSKHFEAGDRTGKLPAVLPMDYAAFAAALGGDRPRSGKTSNGK